jgi:hypothetical protein
MTGLAQEVSATREHPPLYNNSHRAAFPIQPVNPGDPMAVTSYPTGESLPRLTLSGCKGCANEITDNQYCGACDRAPISPRDRGKERPLGALPIIDRFISKENKDYLYNEWKEKVAGKLRAEARQEILDEMKEEKKIYKKAMLGNIVKRASEAKVIAKSKLLIAG